MRSSLSAVVTGLALLLPEAGLAQASKGVAASPGITFQRSPGTPRSDTPPARAISPARHGERHGDRGGATGGDLFLADDHTYAPRYDRRLPARHHDRRTPHIGVRPYFGADADLFVTPEFLPRLPLAVRNTDAGILQLQVEPPSALVVIDGVSFRDSRLATWGSPDVGTGQYLLDAGVHRVEVHADGFEPVSFDVRLRPGDTLTRSQRLTSVDRTDQLASPAPSVTAQTSPKTLYVIPRCYAGDRKPDPAQLLPGCRLDRMRVIPAGR